MGRIILILAMLVSVAHAQTKPPNYTEIAQRYRWISGMFKEPVSIAADTVTLTTAQKAFPWLAPLGDSLYLWSVSGQRWVLAGGAGGGGFDQTITPVQITSTQNNYSPTGFGTSGAIVPVTLRLSSDAARSVTGLDASGFANGKVVIIQNVGTNNITLTNLNGGSSAANRFYFVDNDIVLKEAASVTIIYDDTDNVWRTMTGNVAISPGYGMTSSTGLFPITSAATLRVDTTGLKAQYWGRRGNAAASGAFIGLTDSADLFFQINGIRAGWINTQPLGGNTMFGFRTGSSSPSGAYNTLIGYYVAPNITGGQNTMIGTYSGWDASGTPSENVGVGNGTLGKIQGIRNVAIGASSMAASTTAEQNTSTGNYSMLQNRTGDYNTADGTSALRGNAEGTNNTAIGAVSLTQVTTSIASIAVTNGGTGYTTATVVISAPTVGADPNSNSLQATATATINSGAIESITITQPGKGYVAPVTATITGDGTGATLTVTLTSGEYNTAVGSGSGALLRTGKYNGFFGYNSGTQILYGSYNVILGGHIGTAYANSSRNLILSDGEGTILQRHDSAARWFVPALATAPGTMALRYDPSTDQITIADTTTGGGGGGTPAGSTGEVQFNTGGAFDADDALTFSVSDDEAVLTVGEGTDRGNIMLRAGAGTFTLQAPASGSNVLEAPTNAGTDGQVWTKGAGNTSAWEDAPGSAITVGHSLFIDTLKSGTTVLQMTNRAQINEDFLSSPGSAGGGNFFYDASAGTAADVSSLLANFAGNQGGVAVFNTGTTTTGAGYLASNVTAYAIDTNQYYRAGWYNVRIEDLSDGTETFQVRMGFMLGETVPNEVYFKYTHSLNSGNWTVYSENNNTAENTNTGVTVAADTEYDLEFEIYEGTIRFWINGTLVATHTTQVPQHLQASGMRGPYTAIVKSAGTTARLMYVDAIKIRTEQEANVQN